MGRYLDALKKVEIPGGDYPNKPKELEKGGILGLLGSSSPRFEINNAANEEAAIRAWLSHINETDQEIINDVLDKCQQDAEARAYFLRRAEEAPPPGVCERRVTCSDCRHFRRAEHPHLGHCMQGEPEAIAGLWDTDRRGCESHAPRATETIHGLIGQKTERRYRT